MGATMAGPIEPYINGWNQATKEIDFTAENIYCNKKGTKTGLGQPILLSTSCWQLALCLPIPSILLYYANPYALFIGFQCIISSLRRMTFSISQKTT